MKDDDINELVNIMERWHFGRSEDSEVVDTLDEVLKRNGYLKFFTPER